MEQTLIETIISEHGVVVALFFLTLYGLYKLTNSFLSRYLELMRQHNLDFLHSFDNMVTKV